MARPNRQSRQKAERRGRIAEHVAALSLRLKGYRILESRVKTPVGEIDLIAVRGKTLAFVEVKQRQTYNLALTAVSDRNWQRIASAAANWTAQNRGFAEHDWRYDLMAVSGRYWPRHFPDYWRP